MKVLLDANASISLANYKLNGTEILSILLSRTEITLPETVYQEVTFQVNQYQDAGIIQNLYQMGKLEVVRDGLRPSILDQYKLDKGEKAAMLLMLEPDNLFDYFITDDRLAYVISHRINIPVMTTLDLILPKHSELSKTQALDICQLLKLRFAKGFTEHTIHMIETGDLI